jgi:hypothetical protein
MKKMLTSIGLMGAVILATLWCSANWAEARNPDLSYWMQNLSESPDPLEPGLPNENPEIAVAGSNVHAIWFTGNPLNQLYYRRSADGGRTWEAKQLLFTYEWSKLRSEPTRKRLVAEGDYVHIVVCTDTDLYYFRSTDNGASFEAARILYTAPYKHTLQNNYISASGGKLTIAFLDYFFGLDISEDPRSTGLILNSDDHGVSFSQSMVFDKAERDYQIFDLLRLGDRIYVVYLHSLDRLYLAASSNAGDTFTENIISVLSQDGTHKTDPLQYQHYVPKIAAAGSTVGAIWTGYDADDVRCAFYRRSIDSGVTFGDAVNLSRTVLPEGDWSHYGMETLAAQGNYVYTVFLSNSNWRIFLRRSTNGGGSFLEAQELTSPGVPYINSGNWPLVQTDPNVASGERVHVFWNYPAYCFSTDGGATFSKPALLDPSHWSTAGGARRPQMAIGPDGRVHFVVDASFYSPTISVSRDIFHRVFDNPPPAPSGGNRALKLLSDAAIKRYDNMQAPASSYLNFPEAMTGEVWVKPSPGGTDEMKPIFFKFCYNISNFSYALGTFQRGTKRQAVARIQTAGSGAVWLNPASDTVGLVPDNAWTHLAMTYDPGAGTDNLKLYMNGQLIAAGTATGALVTTDGMFFAGYYGNWEVDELRLWGRALTQAEIAANMSRKLTGTEPGLNAYYNFDNTTLDLTGHGNNGYLMYKEEYVNRTTNPVPNIIFPLLLN